MEQLTEHRGRHMRIPALVLALAVCSCAPAPAPAPVPADTVLTVMTFNTWGGGANEGKSVDDTAAVIRAAGADIVGVQETRQESPDCGEEDCPPASESVAAKLAQALGFHYYDQAKTNDALWANAILSRYPIGAATPNDLGVAIDVEGRRVFAFNIHFTDFPYQPYQVMGIPYGDAPFLKTGAEAAQAARAARGPGVALLVDDLEAAAGADAAFIFGDFNEPSNRDWTVRTAAAGRHPFAVDFPTARAVEGRGFVDAFRVAHPDEVAKPGYTWEAIARPADVQVHHDRIDYVFARGAKLAVEQARIFGEKAPEADVVVTPWPSDHRAVVATVRF
jgi:endonuclease/exonuclease/phosphatase family metal-dependent hydrolase